MFDSFTGHQIKKFNLDFNHQVEYNIQMDGITQHKIKVEYKPRKSIRALKWALSNEATQAVQIAADIKYQIEKKAVEDEISSLENMGSWAVPTEWLYNLADSYVTVYKVALNEGLIRTGNPKSTPNIH